MKYSKNVYGRVLEFLPLNDLIKVIQNSIKMCWIALSHYPWNLKGNECSIKTAHFNVMKCNTHIKKEDMFLLMVDFKKFDKAKNIISNYTINKKIMSEALIRLIKAYGHEIDRVIFIKEDLEHRHSDIIGNFSDKHKHCGDTQIDNVYGYDYDFDLDNVLKEVEATIKHNCVYHKCSDLKIEEYINKLKDTLKKLKKIPKILLKILQTVKYFLSHGADPSYNQNWSLFCALGYPKLLKVLLNDYRSNPNTYNCKIVEWYGNGIPEDVEYGHLLAHFADMLSQNRAYYLYKVEETWDILLNYPKKYKKMYYDSGVYRYIILSPGCSLNKIIKSLPNNKKYGLMLGEFLKETAKMSDNFYKIILSSKKTKLRNQNEIIRTLSYTDDTYALGKLRMILKDKRFEEFIPSIFEAEFSQFRIKRIKIILKCTPYIISGGYLYHTKHKKKVYNLLEKSILKISRHESENLALKAIKWILSFKQVTITRFNMIKYALIASKNYLNKVSDYLYTY